MATSVIGRRALTASTTLYSTNSPVEQDGTTFLQLNGAVTPYPLIVVVLYIDGTSASNRAVLIVHPGTLGLTPWYAVGSGAGAGTVRIGVNGSDTSQLRVTAHSFTKVFVSAIYGLY